MKLGFWGMAKSIPNGSSSSCFGLSRSNLLVPVSVSIRSIQTECSLDSFSRNLPRISTRCRHSHHRRFRCCFALPGSSIEPDHSLTATIFIKGLPRSIGEGELKRSFLEFGEVTRVKIFLEKETMQPLGSAFVWFTNKESAELAVKEMNGKFFEGRFISIAMAKQHRPNEGRRSTAPYKF